VSKAKRVSCIHEMLNVGGPEARVLALAFEEGEEGEGWDAVSSAFGIIGRGGGVDRLPRGYQEVRTDRADTLLIIDPFLDPSWMPDMTGIGQVQG
jgi:hypothetical protein